MFFKVLPIVAMDLFINGPSPDPTPTRRRVYIQSAALHLGSSTLIITSGAVGWGFVTDKTRAVRRERLRTDCARALCRDSAVAVE